MGNKWNNANGDFSSDQWWSVTSAWSRHSAVDEFVRIITIIFDYFKTDNDRIYVECKKVSKWNVSDNKKRVSAVWQNPTDINGHFFDETWHINGFNHCSLTEVFLSFRGQNSCLFAANCSQSKGRNTLTVWLRFIYTSVCLSDLVNIPCLFISQHDLAILTHKFLLPLTFSPLSRCAFTFCLL